MIMCFGIMVIIMIIIRIRISVLYTLVLFLCFSFDGFTCIVHNVHNLTFDFCHNFLPIFNNFGLIFFQSQSKTLLTTNFTTYFLTKFTTISANFSNISIRILLSWSIRNFVFSIQICDLRKLIWEDGHLHFFYM